MQIPYSVHTYVIHTLRHNAATPVEYYIAVARTLRYVTGVRLHVSSCSESVDVRLRQKRASSSVKRLRHLPQKLHERPRVTQLATKGHK